ncbi:hypothetical protein SDC9_144358 [bioreactor metagenome]|uniref:Uncharacterized protein n=1 Tax=bioreactor metagenome TaxID=1076179 RepID=A0A645E6R1_9ZZZZ
MVAHHAVAAAVQLLHAGDFDCVAARAGDFRAHRVEQVGEVAHVRFARRVVERRRPVRDGRRHQDLLGGGHAGFVEEEFAPRQSPGRVEPVSLFPRHFGSELVEPVEVAVEPAAADHVAARRIEFRLAAAGQQRSGEEDAGPVARTKFLRDRSRLHVGAPEAERVVLERELRAQFSRDVEHGADVEDVRHIFQHDLLVGQQQRRDHRQRRVFIPADFHPSADAGGPFHHQTPH